MSEVAGAAVPESGEAPSQTSPASGEASGQTPAAAPQPARVTDLLVPAGLVALALAPFLVRTTLAGSTGEALTWMAITALAAAGIGSLLGWAGVRHGVALGLFTFAAFAPAGALGILVFAALPGPVAVAVAAAALAVPVAGAAGAKLSASVEEFAKPLAIAVVFCLIALLLTSVLVSVAGPRLHDQQEKLSRADRLTAAGLVPVALDIEGYTKEGFFSITQLGDVTSYSLRFEKRGSGMLSESVSIDVQAAPPEDDCARAPESYTCDERAGYTVVSYDGEPERVLARAAGMHLEVRIREEGRSDVDRIGKAMAAAEQSSWNDVLGIR